MCTLWKFRDFTATVFSQKFRQINVLLAVNSSFFHTHSAVWKLQKFSLTLFSQKFREINVFTKEITMELILQMFFFSVRVNFLFFHTVVWKLRNFTATIFPSTFREGNFLLKSCTPNWFDEKYLHGSEFIVFPYCVARCAHSVEIIEI